MVLAMEHAKRTNRPLQYAAARAALWLYNDVPALLEHLLFPNRLGMQACLKPSPICKHAIGLRNGAIGVSASAGGSVLAQQRCLLFCCLRVVSRDASHVARV